MVLTTRGLTKRYGKRTVVDDLSIEVAAGDVYGFLGPNGAGKSTSMRMLVGLVHPTAGEIRVLGERVGARQRAALRRIGAIETLADGIRTPTSLDVIDDRAWVAEGQLTHLFDQTPPELPFYVIRVAL